jgi:Flp pilus assembly protein TadD
MIPPQEAQHLEEVLERDPDDLEALTKLLGYYYVRRETSEQARARHRALVLSVIAKRPVNEVATFSFARLDPVTDAEAHAAALQLWRDHSTSHANDLGVLENAAAALFVDDPEYASTLLERALELEPGNVAWTRQLAKARDLIASKRKQADRSAPS